ncbi:MAG: zf-HC2 domain-containing protein [Burkholderiales bacterium]|nr:zf-HC2 domain-containing protein [Burkholderiales bacterium]
MNKRIVQLDTDSHKAVESLLPWYVTGKLDSVEQQQVAEHLAGCAHCRSALAWEQSLRRHHAAPDTSALDVEASLARMHAQMAAPSRRRLTLPSPAALLRRWRDVSGWARWTMAAQFATIAALAFLAFERPEAPVGQYHALGAPASHAAANVAVTFDPSATESDIRQLLASNNAQIVAGPTAANAYLLHVSSNGKLAQLRANKAVTLAVALDGGPKP